MPSSYTKPILLISAIGMVVCWGVAFQPVVKDWFKEEPKPAPTPTPLPPTICIQAINETPNHFRQDKQGAWKIVNYNPPVQAGRCGVFIESLQGDTQTLAKVVWLPKDDPGGLNNYKQRSQLHNIVPMDWVAKVKCPCVEPKPTPEPTATPLPYYEAVLLAQREAAVKSLLFHNDGGSYGQEFPSSTTTTICWELTLEHPKAGYKENFVIRAVWHYPAGYTREQTSEKEIQSEWVYSKPGYCFTSQTPNWDKGEYLVELFSKDRKIKEGRFKVY